MSTMTKKIRTQRSSFANRACLRVEELESRLVPYALSGSAWVRPELVTIGFVPDGTDLGGVSSNLISTMNARFGAPANWQNQILKAAQVWAQQTNLNFAVITDNGAPIGSGLYQQGDPLMADIRIGGYNFGSSTLARAYLPPQANNFSIAGDMQFNTNQTWVIGTTGGYDLFTVAMHEMGHSLGLLHSTNYFSAMYCSYAGARAGLGSDDITGIRAAYSGGAARAADSYDAVASNGTFGTATNIDSLINWSTLTSQVAERNITTTADVDFYASYVPVGTTGTVTYKVQSSGRSLLAPTLTVYNANQQQVGYVSGAGQYGTSVSITLTGVQAGQLYYIKVAGADTSAFGTGMYGLLINFASNPMPSLYLPNTQTANGSPLQSGGAQPQVSDDGHDHDHQDGCCCPNCGGRGADAAHSEVTNSPAEGIDSGVISILGRVSQPVLSAAVNDEESVVDEFLRVEDYSLLVSETPNRINTAASGTESEKEVSPFASWHDACDACFEDDLWQADSE